MARGGEPGDDRFNWWMAPRLLLIKSLIVRDQSEVLRGRLRMQVGLYLTEIAKGTPEQDLSTQFLSYRTDDIRPSIFNRWKSYLESR